jgi:hypothetical protein
MQEEILIVTFLAKLFRKKKVSSDIQMVLERLIGQKLVGVSCSKDEREWQLHFEDWVVFVENPFPSPIIERISW